MTTYDLASILPLVRLSIPGLGDIFTFDEFAYGILALLEKQGTPTVQKRPQGAGFAGPGRNYNEQALSKDIKIAVVEAFYYCEQHRFILRSPPTSANYIYKEGFNPKPGEQCLVTPRGQEWARTVDPLPEDYNGYMKQFPGTTDKVVLEYVGEALHTFVGGTYFSCAVMIGAASEKCIYLLADALVPALKDAGRQAQLQKKMSARSLASLLKELESIVEQGLKAKVIPHGLLGETTRHLLSIFDHIRLQRNDAIHPMSVKVSADSVRLALMSFPMAFVRVESLRQWCLVSTSSL